MKEVEKGIKEYLVERNWDKLKPADIAKSISIEAAELLELFQWTDEELEKVKSNKDLMREIKKELADVFTFAFEMSIILNLDTKKIIKEKLKYARKKYPAKLMRENAKKQKPGTDSMYWKIKKEYRKKHG